MTKYTVWFKDNATGADSPIDEIMAYDGYMADNYRKDCADSADDGWNEMLNNGTIRLEPVV